MTTSCQACAGTLKVHHGNTDSGESVVATVVIATLLHVAFSVWVARYAKSKGYNPFIWFFAGGVFGYAVLAFLSDTSPLMGRERNGAREKRRFGNAVGVAVVALTLVIAILFELSKL